MSKTIPPTLVYLFKELDTISRIQRGDKLCTRTEYINIEDKSMKSSVERTACGENRTRGITKINLVIVTTIEYSHRVLESRWMDIYSYKAKPNEEQIKLYEERIHWLNELRDRLHFAKFGVKNYSSSYVNDGEITKKCDEIYQTIETHYNALKNILLEYETKKATFNSAAAARS